MSLFKQWNWIVTILTLCSLFHSLLAQTPPGFEPGATSPLVIQYGNTTVGKPGQLLRQSRKSSSLLTPSSILKRVITKLLENRQFWGPRARLQEPILLSLWTRPLGPRPKESRYFTMPFPGLIPLQNSSREAMARFTIL